MVKIINKTKAEKRLEEKVQNLFGIASELFKEGKVRMFLDDDYINVNEDIHVHCYRNLIKINKEKNFDAALKLAEAYEKETGERWALKRMYE